MTDHPSAVLREVRTLKARSRRLAHGGAWLPALVLAALPLLSIPLYGANRSGSYQDLGSGSAYFPYWAGLPYQQRYSLASYVFWLVAEPLAFVVVAWWYRRRERRRGVRVAWHVPVIAGVAGLLALVALVAAPAGEAVTLWGPQSLWQGLLTPLLSVGLAAIALGVIERSVGIALCGAWITLLAWQFCALGLVGGLLGWQAWLLGGGSGPGLGGQLTLLGMDRPAPALLVMALPLAVVATYRAVRARGSLT